ncbi:MAG: hypothetical protein FJ100_06890 [Deltaproteobacteria bacterium]|nr:hypothetical protein [Deltaproteobacteria bacterium]
MPWLYTCRHGCEATLRRELARAGVPTARTETLLPGLVRAGVDEPCTVEALDHWNPAYALQVLPDARSIRGQTVREMCDAALALLPAQWDAWPGRWDVHALVPGQLKGQPRPAGAQRAQLVRDGLHKALARRRTVQDHAGPGKLMQLLLLGPDTAWFSASPIVHACGALRWPSPFPAGLADPADDPAAPNSAFRKLREALAWLGEPARPGDTVVDLGASPGGWTHVLRQLGCAVTAVDRAPLAPNWVADLQVTAVVGDAFSWQPAGPVAGLVCDVIATPDRCCALLETWCTQRWMRWFVVHLKFKGEPDWLAIARATSTARAAGYASRARHFFNDKNEVTVVGLARE